MLVDEQFLKHSVTSVPFRMLGLSFSRLDHVCISKYTELCDCNLFLLRTEKYFTNSFDIFCFVSLCVLQLSKETSQILKMLSVRSRTPWVRTLSSPRSYPAAQTLAGIKGPFKMTPFTYIILLHTKNALLLALTLYFIFSAFFSRSCTPSPKPPPASKSSHRQALSAVEAYTKLLQEQSRTEEQHHHSPQVSYINTQETELP